MTGTGGWNAEAGWKWWTNARLLRWGLAASLLLLVFGLFGDYLVCKDQLATVGDSSVVETCVPPTVTDLPVVAALMLLVVVLAPDLSEVSIGLLALKQRVQETERDQKEIRDEFGSLKQSFAISATAQAEQAQSVVTAVQAPDLAATAHEARGDDVDTVRELAAVASRDPGVAGAEKYAKTTDPEYAKVLGDLIVTLARLAFSGQACETPYVAHEDQAEGQGVPSIPASKSRLRPPRHP